MSGNRSGLEGLRVLALVRDGDSRVMTLTDAGRDALGWSIEAVQTDLAPLGDVKDWEKDESAVAAIDEFIGMCERTSGVPAGRIVLTGPRDIGRGFSRPNIDLPESPLARKSAADVAEPFRVVRRLFFFARDTLHKFSPDLILADSFGEPLPLAFRLVAQHMGLRCLACRPSQIWNGRLFWTADPAGFNHAARAEAEAKRLANAPVSMQAQNYVTTFRNGPQGAGAQDDTPARSHRSGPFVRFDTDSLQQMRYVYMALQAEPAEALDLAAPFWATQYYTAGFLTSGLPAGYRLLVQDHPENVTPRPAGYYRHLSRLPGIDLVDPADDRRKYIAHAALVVTENGPAGWEGLLLDRPVLTLSDNFFQAAGLAHRLRHPEHLSRTVIDLLAPTPERDNRDRERSLGWMIDAEWETSAADGDVASFDLLRRALGPDEPRTASRRMEAVP